MKRVNIVVFGPGMEARPLPQWALRPVDDGSLTALEVAARLVGTECGTAITILGPPWVNPRGRSRATASIEDYLADPLILLRALTVALKAPRVPHRADGAVVGVPIELEKEMGEARSWVTRHARELPLEPIVWVPLGTEVSYDATLSEALRALF